jgi:septum site-determining protein MinC
MADRGDMEVDAASGVESELFGTATMAELYARQGRLDEAVAIYRKLLAGRPPADERYRWSERLEALDRARAHLAHADLPLSELPRPAPVARASRLGGGRSPLAPPQPTVVHRMPMLVRQPVRSGQVIHAENTDLIVLAPVNPGAQLVADGNIHVYSVLRGRALAGAQGCADARVFCQRLEAELIGIAGVLMTFEDIPPQYRGRPAQAFLEAGRCLIAPL